jgi:ATP-dependent RNA helicase SUPV3L1/SUV3
MIEVWRLRRQHREASQPARHGRSRPGQRPDQGERRDGGRPRREPPREQSQRSREQGGPPGERPRPERRAEAAGEGERRTNRPRYAEDRRGGSREPRADAPRGNGQGARGPNRPREDRRMPDPDSPFAKLLALKAQLEGRDGDKQ